MDHSVMLVAPDDSPALSLHCLLETRGCTVLRLRQDLGALDWAEKHQPRLILLAASPERNTALCLTLKQHRATNPIPVVQLVAGDPPQRLHAEPDAWLDEVSVPAVHEALAVARSEHEERQREGVRAEVRLVLPSDPAGLQGLRDYLADWFDRCGLTRPGVRRLTTAVHELAANSMEWGHDFQPGRPVRLHCRLDSEKVSVLVRDSGPGFDRFNLPHAARPGDAVTHLRVRAWLNLRPGGYGLLLARGMVDHLCFNDTGTEGLIIQYLPEPGAPGRDVRSMLFDCVP